MQKTLPLGGFHAVASGDSRATDSFSFMGGCAGSTAGGMKIIRWVLLWKQGRREITKLLHPAAVLPAKLGGKPVFVRVVEQWARDSSHHSGVKGAEGH